MVSDHMVYMDLPMIRFKYQIIGSITLEQVYTSIIATDMMLLRTTNCMIYPVKAFIVIIQRTIMALGKFVGMLLTEPIAGRFILMDTLAPMIFLGIRLMGEAAAVLVLVSDG